MKRLAAAIAFVSLLPLAGCGYSRGAWAYYDDNYDSGQEGYVRPITYYGEPAAGLPDGNPGYAEEPRPAEPVTPNPNRPQPPRDFEQPGPDYAGAPPEPSWHCDCTRRPSRRIHASQPPKPAHDPSWYSTYYSIGP